MMHFERRKKTLVRLVALAIGVFLLSTANVVTAKSRKARDTGGPAQLVALGPERVEAVALSPDGRTVAAIDDENLLIWDSVTGELKRTPSASDTDMTRAVAYSPDGHFVAVSTYDRAVGGKAKLRFWDPASGAELRTVALPGSGSGADSLAFSKDGRWLACGRHNSASVVDVESGTIVKDFPGLAGGIGGVAFSPDGRILFAAGYRNYYALDPTTGATIYRSKFKGDHAGDAAFSPDGSLVGFCCGGEESVVLLDPGTWTESKRLSGHRRVVNTIAFSPDGSLLASGSSDETIKIWDVASGAPKITLERDRNPVPGVASSAVLGLSFSRDGKIIATAAWDGMKLWRVRDGRLLATFLHWPVRGKPSGIEHWMTFTPEWHYTGSVGVEKNMRWKVGSRLLMGETHQSTYRKPDQVSRSLKGR